MARMEAGEEDGSTTPLQIKRKGTPETLGLMSSPEAHVLLDASSESHDFPYSARSVLVHLGNQLATRIEYPEGVLVARPVPSPVLASVGKPNTEQTETLGRLSGRIRALLKRARHVSYDQVERDCEVLAERLSDRLQNGTLEDADFVGIPRGGLIVLGMLSYALDLPHARLEPPTSGEGPLVVVDDCALTGSRFRRFLRQHPDREVIFAPLYAHPELCATIEREEPRVTACVNAQDLHDYAPEELGEDHSEWQAQWHQRHSDERYWIGRTEHLCFPWGEADTATWNPKRKQVEQGLSVVPPEHRLKTRPGVDSSQREPSASVQVQPDPAGPIRPSPPVLFGQVGNHTIVANPEADVCIELGGTAAAMWHALVEHGTIGDTMGALRQAYSVGETTLRADLVDFAKQLAVHDLLHVPDGSFA